MAPRSNAKRGCDLLNSHGWRHSPGSDGGLNARKLRFECGVGFEAREHAVFKHRPHPFHLLLAPARITLPGFAHALAVIEDVLPEVGNAGPGQRRIGYD